jgi:peptidoglycan/xylan/chitin deacetylase (PgdA/CDA1 family)
MPTIRSRVAGLPLTRRAYHGLLKCARRSGLPTIWHVLSGRQHAILTFHRVRPAGQPADPFDTCPSVSIEVFRSVLAHAREHFDCVPLRELVDGYGGKAPAAAVTFDDGWRDNYELAFPILRELGIPATIFVTTGKIGNSEPFWQQRLGRMFRAAIASPAGDAARALREVLDVRDGQTLTPELYHDTVVCWKRRKRVDCTDLVRRMESTTASGADDARQFLNAAEIRELAAAGIAFGSHTVTHRILPHYGRREIEWELSESKAVLEDLLRSPIDMLAYPDGQCSDSTLQCARAAGYRIGCTTRNRRLSTSDDRLCLPRLEFPWTAPPNY